MRAEWRRPVMMEQFQGMESAKDWLRGCAKVGDGRRVESR